MCSWKAEEAGPSTYQRTSMLMVFEICGRHGPVRTLLQTYSSSQARGLQPKHWAPSKTSLWAGPGLPF